MYSPTTVNAVAPRRLDHQAVSSVNRPTSTASAAPVDGPQELPDLVTSLRVMRDLALQMPHHRINNAQILDMAQNFRGNHGHDAQMAARALIDGRSLLKQAYAMRPRASHEVASVRGGSGRGYTVDDFRNMLLVLESDLSPTLRPAPALGPDGRPVRRATPQLTPEEIEQGLAQVLDSLRFFRRKLTPDRFARMCDEGHPGALALAKAVSAGGHLALDLLGSTTRGLVRFMETRYSPEAVAQRTAERNRRHRESGAFRQPDAPRQGGFHGNLDDMLGLPADEHDESEPSGSAGQQPAARRTGGITQLSAEQAHQMRLRREHVKARQREMDELRRQPHRSGGGGSIADSTLAQQQALQHQHQQLQQELVERDRIQRDMENELAQLRGEHQQADLRQQNDRNQLIDAEDARKAAERRTPR